MHGQRKTEPTGGKTEMKYEATLQLSYFKPSTEAALPSLRDSAGQQDLLQLAYNSAPKCIRVIAQRGGLWVNLVHWQTDKLFDMSCVYMVLQLYFIYID